jgi:hypothetical protein
MTWEAADDSLYRYKQMSSPLIFHGFRLCSALPNFAAQNWFDLITEMAIPGVVSVSRKAPNQVFLMLWCYGSGMVAPFLLIAIAPFCHTQGKGAVHSPRFNERYRRRAGNR